jgi:MFS transporter, DHA1 family, multidrug resistance protein
MQSVSTLSASYGRLMRREVIEVCVLIFIADIVVGVQSPIFALYVTSLGAGLGMLGLVTSVLGLARLASALPAGVISDRLGPKTVLVAGMLLYAVSFVLYALAPSPEWLIVPRILQAGGMVATFPMGVAYISDVVETRDRSAAIGLYTAAMGSGFAVGPLIGSWVGSAAGYPAAYMTGAVIALVGAVFAALRLVGKRIPPPAGGAPGRLVDFPAIVSLMRHPAIVMACVANIAMTVSMTGAIFTYFPVYARSVGIGTVTIGTLFAWRAIASASGRIPMGPLSERLPAHWTLAAVLLVEAVIDFALVRTASPLVLTVLLVIEGIGFGVFLVSSQAAVSAAGGKSTRGAAVGIFWMAGAAGEVVGLVFVGVVAQYMGLLAVFGAVAATAVVSAVVVAALGLVGAQDSRQHARVEVAAGDHAHDPLE